MIKQTQDKTYHAELLKEERKEGKLLNQGGLELEVPGSIKAHELD